MKKSDKPNGGFRSRLFSLRALALLLWALISVVAVQAIARYYHIRTPGLSAVWKIGKMFRRDYAEKQAKKDAIRAAREMYKDTAMITLATGDSAAKHAVVLLKGLRDTGTQIPHLIVLLSRGGMGSADCHNETLRNQRNRHYHCSGPLTQVRSISSNIAAVVRVVRHTSNCRALVVDAAGCPGHERRNCAHRCFTQRSAPPYVFGCPTNVAGRRHS